MGWFRKSSGPGEDRTVIDLRGSSSSKPTWGSPLPCPECGGRGYLDHIDPFRDVMYQHCTVCQERYAVTKADFDALIA
jgi:DnaJ-class molecular chaperone